MTSTSGTNHMQFNKIIFSADRRCLRQLQSSYVVYNNGLYTTWLFLFNRSRLLGCPGFDIEFYCKRKLNAFEMIESKNWKKEIVIENLNCNHHQH